MTTLLRLESLNAFYGNVQSLWDVSLEVSQGEVIGIIGANGAGKTTVLRAISRLVETQGTLEILGVDAASFRTEHVAQLGVAHVPEGRGTFTELSVEENLSLAAKSRPSTLASELADDMEIVFSYFPVLRDFLARPAGSLSGGQQQMLALARGLVVRPRLLMVDEPTLGLAPRLAQEIMQGIRELGASWGTSIVIVEQNAKLALRVVDRVYLMESGRIARSGTSAELASDALVSSYLGA